MDDKLVDEQLVEEGRTAGGVIIEFRGRLDAASFGAFARHRAGRLALDLMVLAEDGEAARYRVSGPPDLVDAFEVAMSLGPADSLVLDVHRWQNRQD